MAVRHTEVTAAKTMIERAHDRLDLWPERLIADAGYGSAEMLDWLVNDRGIEPHIPVFDKSKRTDDTFSCEDFAYDHASDTYRCPGGKILRRYREGEHRIAFVHSGIPGRVGPSFWAWTQGAPSVAVVAAAAAAAYRCRIGRGCRYTAVARGIRRKSHRVVATRSHRSL